MPWGPQPWACLERATTLHMRPSCCSALPCQAYPSPPGISRQPEQPTLPSQRSSLSRDPKAPSETGDSWKPGLPWFLVGVMPARGNGTATLLVTGTVLVTVRVPL